MIDLNIPCFLVPVRFSGRFITIILGQKVVLASLFTVRHVFFKRSFARRNFEESDFSDGLLSSRGLRIAGLEVFSKSYYWTQFHSLPVLSRFSSKESMRTGKSTPRAKVNPIVTIMRTVVQKQINHDQTLSWLYEDILSQRRAMLAIFTLYFNLT